MTMSMHHLVQEYLKERRDLGFALTIPGSQLQAFARFADASGHRGPLTRELITRWARDEAKRATPLTWAKRIEAVRPFAKHRARVEPGTYVPDADTFGPSRRRLAPHLYTDQEIVDLLVAAGRLSPKGTMRPATYRTLLGLIAATGLRLSEALRLTCGDVDLDAGMLTVRQTKFAKSRLVPLHPTTVRALKQYLALRRRHVLALRTDLSWSRPRARPCTSGRCMGSSVDFASSWAGRLAAAMPLHASTICAIPSSVGAYGCGTSTAPTSTMPWWPCRPTSDTPRSRTRTGTSRPRQT